MKIRFVSSIKDRFMNLGIKSKMILINCFIIFLVAFSMGMTAYILYQQTLTNRLATVNLRDLGQIGSSLDFIQKDLVELSSFIGADSIVHRTICYSGDELDKNPKDQSYVRYMINNMLVSKGYISFISLFAQNGFSYYAAADRSGIIPEFDKIKQTELYQRAYEGKGTPLWEYIPLENTDYVTLNRSDKISMFRTLLKLNDYSTKAFMMISINISSIKELYKNILEVNDSTLIFIDEHNKPLFHDSNVQSGLNIRDMLAHVPKEAYRLSEGTNIYDYQGEKYLLTFTTLKQARWKLLNLVPLKSFAINLRYVPVIVICIFVLALIVGFYFTTFTSSFLTKPIKNLLKSMDRVKNGHFKETVKFKYTDEIGELCLNYNEMIAHINNLLNQVYALEIEEKIAELKALEAQINPHFLYNTLDTVYWKAVAGDNKGVQEMIHALAKVFRLALNVGKEFSTIAQEKEFIGYYILLQEKRYKNKLQYEIQFSPDILNYHIPKLILQPFVENAIIHGTETGDKQTTVSILGFMEENKVHFVIEDNGTGMPPAVLEKLIDPNTDNGASANKGGYGIRNVINRLSLYYGEDYHLDIKSELGNGTKINIVLPVTPKLTFEREGGRIYA